MKLYEMAIEKEKAAKEYYEHLSECAINSGIKKIFKMLAEEESKHFDVIKGISNYSGMDKEAGVAEEATATLLSVMKLNEKALCNSVTLEAYRKAIEMEEESIRIYENAFTETEDASKKDAFRLLSEQERKHKLLIENIIEFVTQPEMTLENAEFDRNVPNF